MHEELSRVPSAENGGSISPSVRPLACFLLPSCSLPSFAIYLKKFRKDGKNGYVCLSHNQPIMPSFKSRSICLYLLIAASSFLLLSCSHTRNHPPKVLVFTKTAGYHHASISDGVKAVEKLGEQHGFTV